MVRKFILLFLPVALCMHSASVVAQVSSIFSANDEGWTVSDINHNNPKTVTHSTTGGNPGGYVSTFINIAQGYYWNSPLGYTGDRFYTSYGLALKFDLQASVTPTQHGVSYGDVILEATTGERACLVLSSFPAVAPSWTSFAVKLDETENWRYGSVGGAAVTKEQIVKILTNLREIRILSQFTNTNSFTCGLDNVIMETRAFQAPPSITSFTPLSASPGAAVTISGTGFNTTAANNVVYFGGVKGTVTAASATQLTVTIPNGATVSPLSVTNTASGLAGRSQKNFNPTWGTSTEIGGRIVRASFKDKVDFLLETPGNIAHFSVGDLDGDGWNDLLIGEAPSAKLSIFRNKGEGGAISVNTFDPKVQLTLNRGGKVFNRIGDLDGDGKPDIVVGSGNGFYSWVGWFRNTSTPGNLTFDAIEELPSLGYIDGPVHIDDMDGDGRLDIIAVWDNSCGGAGTYVGIFHNASTPGNIEFSSFFDFDFNFVCPGSGPSTGDLNGDGKPELILVRGFGASFAAFENTSTPGTISFNAPFAIDVNGTNMLMVDFDGDGKLDLASSGFSTTSLNVRKNNYTSGPLDINSFGPNIVIESPLGYIQEGVAAADVNGDGKPDIVLLGSSDMGVFENVSTPGSLTANSFVPGVPYRNQNTSYPEGPIVADFNGDNKPEIVGSTNSTPKFFIAENINTHAPVISSLSTMKGAAGSTVTITGDHFSAVPSENIVYFGGAIATVQNATKTSLEVTVPAGATYAPVTVTRNGFSAQTNLPFTVTFSPGTVFDATSFLAPVNFTVTNADYDVDIGDIDFDGKPDIAIEGLSFRSYIFQNTHSSGNITAASLAPADTTNSSAQNMKLVDLDGDGKLDLISSNGIYRNNTNSPLNFSNLVSEGQSTNASWADVNHDGKIDLISLYGSGNSITVMENRTTPGPFTNGASSYLASFAANSEVTVPKLSNSGGTASADFDGDGFAEFAATDPANDNVRIWLNAGGYKPATTMFTTFIDLPSGDNPGRIYTADFDVDGKVDLVVYNGSNVVGTGQSLTVYHNQSTTGNLSFSSVTLTVGSQPGPLAVGDLDGDGKPDIVVTSEAAGRFSIFKNQSSPGTLNATSFGAPVHYAMTAPRSVAIGDISLDGRPDLVFSRGGNLMSIVENAIPSTPTISFTSQPVANTLACQGTNVILTVATTGTTNITHQWQRFNTTSSLFEDITNGGAFSGVTTNTLTINTTGGAGAGEYRCRANGDNAPEAYSATAIVAVNSLPAAPAATGDSNCVPSALILNATGSTNGFYRWYNVPTAGSSLGSNSSFTTPVLSATMSFYVAITDGTCESARTEVIAEIKALDKPLVTSTPGATNFSIDLCEGESATLNAPAGFANYNWSNGATTQSTNANTTGGYTVTVTDAKGCVSPASDAIVVTVYPYPVAEIMVSGTVLTSTPGDSYQWFNNNAITNATGQSYPFSVFEYGVYAVEVTADGCTTRSEDFVYLITAVEKDDRSLVVFPNPFEEKIYIQNRTGHSGTLTLLDAQGRIVRRLALSADIHAIEGSALASGLYQLVVQLPDQTKVFKIHKP